VDGVERVIAIRFMVAAHVVDPNTGGTVSRPPSAIFIVVQFHLAVD